ncbi:formin 20 [Olea europaea subsp. europaea]|uniref:Formin 20 n=1 Tax=Olea europaea subsp. europaea TaxID=158383 RepID=A0A8S0RWQ3_OLEEU|nr:formin 20 [Olea europaea subsp. europaea]
MDADGDSPPFWSQPTTTTFFYSHRRPRQPSPIFNPVILILAIPILILVILFFLVPPFISHTTQILHLNSVKKGWDSLIIVLVLFAILCGLFARINDDVPSSDAADQQNLNVPQVSDFARPPPGESVSSSQWYGFFDGKEYGDLMSVKSEGGDSMGPSISCPSPDVDAKAEAFIARLRDEWKLDKMNSINEKRKLG